MENILLETRNLSKRFCRDPRLAQKYTIEDILWEFRRQSEQSDSLRKGEFWAVNNVSLQLKAGESLGLIGHNGSGKSTLLNLLIGILRPTRGEIRWYTDRIIMIDNQSGLNPVQTGRENIYNKLSMHGMPLKEISENVDEIIDHSGIRDFIDSPLGTYSTGMRLRLAFSIYTRLCPDVFIIDEALGGGDIKFREKFNHFLRNYLENGGSLILVSHEPIILQSLCDQCLILDHGKEYRLGKTSEVLFDYYELMQIKAEDQINTQLPLSQQANQTSLFNQQGYQFGMVQITEVKITPLDAPEVRPGSQVKFEIICESQIDKENIEVYILVRRSDTSHLALLYGGYGDRSYSIKVGTNHFSCLVENLPFMPGRYNLIAGISHMENHSMLGLKGVTDVPMYLEVKSFHHPALQVCQGVQTSIYLPGQWH